MGFKIISDSACDLDLETAKKLDIDIMPIIISKDDITYREGVDIDSQTVYDQMREGVVYKTAQIPLNEYINIFSDYASKNIPVINICLSTGISHSYNTSLMAINQVKEQYPDMKVYSLDSKLCAMGHGIFVKQAALVAKNHDDIEYFERMLKYIRENLVSLGCLDNLMYLSRGGRISKTAAFLGNTLNIKPFIQTDPPTGKLELFDKVRGKKKIYKKFIELIKERNVSNDFSTGKIYIQGSTGSDLAIELKKAIIDDMGINPDNIVISEIGTTIGVHVGPESVFLFFMKNPLPDEFLK